MKKIIGILVVLFLSVLWLSGCGEDRNRSGLIGSCDDFVGIWEEKDQAGGFGIGDTLKFNGENNCQNSTYEMYWSHGGAIHHYGNWERTTNATNGHYIIILKMGEKETTYYFDFFDSYKTLRLREENSDDYMYYYKK